MVKKTITLLFCFTALLLQARQLHTIKSGNWESDSVWYDQMHPSSIDDTFLIQHYISLNSNIILQNNELLHIDTNGALCGNYNMSINGHSTLLNEGFLGLLHLEINSDSSYNYLSGYIDIGDSGMIVRNTGGLNDPYLGDTYFYDNGCLNVHAGPQLCNYPCKLIDTVFQININERTVSITADSQTGNLYYYSFSDGGRISTYDTNVNYTFADTGTYAAQLMVYYCCKIDTFNRLIHITYTSDTPGVPGTPDSPYNPHDSCQDDSVLLIYPNPTDAGFFMRRVNCTDENVNVKVYSAIGQLVFSGEYQTVQKIFNAYISSEILANGCYIVDVELKNKSFKRKVVVAH